MYLQISPAKALLLTRAKNMGGSGSDMVQGDSEELRRTKVCVWTIDFPCQWGPVRVQKKTVVDPPHKRPLLLHLYTAVCPLHLLYMYLKQSLNVQIAFASEIQICPNKDMRQPASNDTKKKDKYNSGTCRGRIAVDQFFSK